MNVEGLGANSVTEGSCSDTRVGAARECDGDSGHEVHVSIMMSTPLVGGATAMMGDVTVGIELVSKNA